MRSREGRKQFFQEAFLTKFPISLQKLDNLVRASVQTGDAPNLGRKADPITLTCVVTDPQPEYMVEISEGSE